MCQLLYVLTRISLHIIIPLKYTYINSTNIKIYNIYLQIPKYRVVLLGDSGVGKTALVSQFMTSEYMNTYDASLGKLIIII